MRQAYILASLFHMAHTCIAVQEGQPLDPDARAAWPWWKAKKWVLHITYRLFSRYGDPKTSRSGADGDFIMLFSQQCSLKFLEAHMKLMASYSQVCKPTACCAAP